MNVFRSLSEKSLPASGLLYSCCPHGSSDTACLWLQRLTVARRRSDTNLPGPWSGAIASWAVKYDIAKRVDKNIDGETDGPWASSWPTAPNTAPMWSFPMPTAERPSWACSRIDIPTSASRPAAKSRRMKANRAVHVFLGVNRDLSQEPSSLVMLLDEPAVIAGHEHNSLEMQMYGFDKTMAPLAKGSSRWSLFPAIHSGRNSLPIAGSTMRRSKKQPTR